MNYAKRSDVNGFTIIELLVSSALLGIGIIALVAIITKGQEIAISDSHRKSAFIQLSSIMEDTVINENFATFSVTGGWVTSAESLLISARDASNPKDDLKGQLRYNVSQQYIDPPIGRRRILLELTWREPEGIDTLSLEKWITEF
ncbi:MAG: hypothetical protein GF398_12640 [Chitinivibrionales bacterium]|nr:hypothetical protein [Chitinivibrionales bacterium]